MQTREYTLQHRAGTAEGNHFYEDVRLFLHTSLPFLGKWGRVPDNYEDLCQQALGEMRQPCFVSTWKTLTAWGINQEVAFVEHNW